MSLYPASSTAKDLTAFRNASMVFRACALVAQELDHGRLAGWGRGDALVGLRLAALVNTATASGQSPTSLAFASCDRRRSYALPVAVVASVFVPMTTLSAAPNVETHHVRVSLFAVARA